jgi:hypothetical protein
MTCVEPRADTGSMRPSPPERPGFASTAAHFELLADKARDEDQRQRWLEVAGFYRSLAQIIPAMPNDYKHNGQVPPLTRAERWRARAEECRSLADCFTDPTCRRQLIDLAAGYESMAAAAE